MATIPERTDKNNKTFQGRIIQKHDTKANWDKATNFVPLKGEIIIYDDLKKIKIGDGATKVENLIFINDLDTINGKYLPLTGGTMTGNININNKTITNLKTPTADTEAANKKYVDDQVAANDHIVNRFTFTATAGQSTFTIPFDFEDSSALTVYYNGIMMREIDNYTVSGKNITLAGFTAEASDYLTVMGIEGAAAIDFGKEAEDAIKQIQAIKTSSINEINTVKEKTLKDINDLVANLPSDTASLMFINKTNTMAANGKITMASTYSPSDSGDIATKKYVDDSKPSIVGTATTFPIYIGSSTPASGTAPLLWIDTSSSGTFKYRTSKTGTWTIVPVAWS